MRTRLLAVAIALLWPLAAQASEFWYVAEGQTYSFWLDAQTLETKDAARSVTIYQIFSHPEPVGVRVAMARADFKCGKNTIDFLPGIALGNELAPLSPLDEREGVPVSPESALGHMYVFVCGSVADRSKNGRKFGDNTIALKDVVAAYLKTFSR